MAFPFICMESAYHFGEMFVIPNCVAVFEWECDDVEYYLERMCLGSIFHLVFRKNCFVDILLLEGCCVEDLLFFLRFSIFILEILPEALLCWI